MGLCACCNVMFDEIFHLHRIVEHGHISDHIAPSARPVSRNSNVIFTRSSVGATRLFIISKTKKCNGSPLRGLNTNVSYVSKNGTPLWGFVRATI